jgi:hypothetical protein
LQNLHPAGHQPDANLIQLTASLMRISFSRHPDANFIQSVASWMQIASG